MTLFRRRFVAGLCAAAASPALHAQARVTLRLHQFLSPQAPSVSLGLLPWARRLQEGSGGRIRVQPFAAMQLGGRPSDLLDQARSGVVDLAWTVLGYTPGRFPRAEVFELPFLCGGAEAGSRAFQRYVQAHAMAEFAGLKLICVHIHGPGLLHSRTPVTQLQDLKGMRVRGGSRVINRMLEHMGAVPVGMPAPQVSEALSKGVINAATLPMEVAPSLKVQQIVRHHTGFAGGLGMYTQTFALLMNQARYDSLPADLRQVIDAHSGVRAAAAFGRAIDEGDAAGIALARQAGNSVLTLSASETSRWQHAAASTRDAWLAQAKAQGIDGAHLLAQAQRLLAQEAEG